MTLRRFAISLAAPQLRTKIASAIIVVCSISFGSIASADTVSFEDLPASSAGYNNGNTTFSSADRQPFTVVSEGPNGWGDFQTDQYFTSGSAEFGNQYSSAEFYDYWSGWAWSNVVDTDDGSYFNQYAAWTGGGSDGNGGTNAGENYAVAFGDNAWINLTSGQTLQSLDITNTTLAAKTMLEGINNTGAFGGVDGTDEDFFSVTIHGFDGISDSATELISRTVYLADYRFADSSEDYVLDQWLTVDLSDFENVQQLRFTFDGSDTGMFGLNTPAYFAMDNLSFTAVPEPSAALLLSAAATLLAMRRRRVSA